MGSLQILFKRYLRKNMSSYLAGTVCLLATNYLAVTIPEQIGAAVDVLTTPENLSAISPYVFNIAWMGLTVVVVRTLSRVLFNPDGCEYRIRRDMFQSSAFTAGVLCDPKSRGHHFSCFFRHYVGSSTHCLWHAEHQLICIVVDVVKMGSVLVLTAITLAPIIFKSSFKAPLFWYPMMKRNQEYLLISRHV